MPHILEVFLTFLRIGLVSFGGGMANLPEMSRILIGNGWLTGQQFADGFALGQFVPGPNMLAMVFYGYSAAGWLGSLAAVVGMFMPGALAAIGLVWGWQWLARAQWSRALRKALVPISMGLSLSMLMVLIQLGIDGWVWFGVMAVATYLIYREVNVVVVIVGGALVGLLLPH